ncbi:MFS quinate transporter-like protein [Pleomassaria siparia CBS 279.74]|uniref:MFS quinate transporter-like protein n=1 Tax=Pleomassaria siparia CBS 279.74 TaxID=1314801 RepID=A0A6G1KSN4_9PLEO|nr:MFS quinate transporter-like protein [Pleomassaria siparia CBS 279.74]
MVWNPWRENLKDTPKESLNWRLWYGVFVFGLMGAARGIDEGLIGTTAELDPFVKKFGLEDPSKSEHDKAELLSNITSMVQMGSILGALVAFFLTDRIGRLWATRMLCVFWVIGISIFLASASTGSIAMVYVGRFIAGVGIGQTTVVAPTYLAETAPRAIRGLCVGAFAGCVYLGIMLAYFASWGSSLHISSSTDAQWLVPNSMHLMFAGIIFLLSFFTRESPRWLIKVGRHEEALENLTRLRQLPADHPYIQSEVFDINDQLNREKEATMGTTWLGPIRELFTGKGNLYRIQLSIMSQLLGQWSGASSITIYAPQYFAMMGTTGQKEKLFATAIFGLVKFISSMLCAFVLIDLIGRKRALSTGITIQFLAMMYMAIFLLVDNKVSDKTIPQTSSQKHAAMGAIVMIYFSGFGWALGWNSIQYLINSEIYPLRLRALGGSMAMTFHFVNQYGNSKAVPLMFIGMTTGGTMMFFSCVTAIGLAWVYFFLPETAGKSLEAMDELFNLPWHLIGRKGKELTRGSGGMADVMDTEGEKSVEMRMEAVGVEKVEQRGDTKV